MKKLFCILLFSTFSLTVFAQEFEVPENYSFCPNEDYSAYHGQVLEGINWLLETPANVQPQKRKKVSKFVLSWLSGTPTVNIVLESQIINFMDTSPDLLIIFLCGWAKYSIETKDNTNMVNGNLNGIDSVIEFYTKNRAHQKKDKNIEKYIKLKTEGKLEKSLSRNVTNNTHLSPI